ncbi:MAG: flippase-like domain-containing protein [Chloroflexi bacterium]|nr:flippase-like domain-containing protein [Chloroflexota bacterium]
MKNLTRKLAAGLILGFLVFIALAVLGDIRQVGEELAGFTWSLVPLILASTVFGYVLRFVKWHYYLGRIGVNNISVRESARIFVAGFPLAVTPGKAGEALKATWLKRAVGTPTPKGLMVVLAERISDGLGVLLLSTVGVFAYRQYWPIFSIVAGALIGVILISQIRPLGRWLIDFSRRIPIVRRVADPLSEFYEGSYVLFRPKATLIAVALGTVAWLGEGVAMYLVLLGLGVAPTTYTFGIAVFVLSFSTIVGAISALPGGLVAADGSIAGMLALLLGLSATTAASATLLIRFATLWFGVGLGLLVWLTASDLFAGEPDPKGA